MDGPSLGSLKVQLAAVLCELSARVDEQGRPLLNRSDVAYGLRFIARTGTKMRFFEATQTSARILGMNEKTARMARAKFVRLGLLVDQGTKHGPGKSRQFAVRIPPELEAGYRARLAPDDCTTEGVAMPGVEAAEEWAYSGHPEAEHRASGDATPGVQGLDTGHSYALQTLEPEEPKEPAAVNSNGSAVAASVAPLRMGAPRGGGLSEADEERRREELRRQARKLIEDHQAGRL